MGFLAINMSGSTFPVWDTNYVQIGRIYPKERFSVISKGTVETKINFRNSAGQWVAGFCEASGSALSDWSNYLYLYSHTGRPYFKIDRTIQMYNSGGKPAGTFEPGVIVVPFNSTGKTQTGDSNTDWLRIKELWYSDGNIVPGNQYGMFIDCKIRENSMDTPVYGNWN